MCGLGQVWYLIVSIPGLCLLPYFEMRNLGVFLLLNKTIWSCKKNCDALHYLLDNMFIRFISKLYRQTVGIDDSNGF